MDVSSALDADGAHGSPWARRAGVLAFNLAHAALDALYPPTCLACRSATDRHGALCPRCWSAMRFIERPFCERLGTPFEQDLGQGLISPQAMADPLAFSRARAVAKFEDGPARTLVHRLKYSDRRPFPADRELDGSRRGRHSGRRGHPGAGAAARPAAVATAVQPGGRASYGSLPPNGKTVQFGRAATGQGGA